jgi:hypothetical protein
MARFKHPTLLKFSRPNLQRQRSSTCRDALPATFTYKHPLPVSHSYPLVPTSSFQTPRCVDRLSAGDRRAANVNWLFCTCLRIFAMANFHWPCRWVWKHGSNAVGGTHAAKISDASRIENARSPCHPGPGTGNSPDCKAPSGKGTHRARGRCPQGAKCKSCGFPMACTDGG